MTSEQLSRTLSTNPVVIRRIMAGLRDMGIVQSERGHGGGWTISRDLGSVSLRDVYAALGEPMVFALGNRRRHRTAWWSRRSTQRSMTLSARRKHF